MTDPVTALVDLVHAYHWRWTVVHGDHGPDCELCAGLHERHAWALAAVQAAEPDDGAGLEAVA